jgi:PTS system nitrogen regulatory IIA component
MEQNDVSGLVELVRRGGVFRDIPGTGVREVLTNLVERLPGQIDREKLLQAVLEREALMPTGIGKGIALPHPRNPVITEREKQFIAIGFPSVELDWHAGQPVHTLLLIVSASARLHLQSLSWVNFFCQQESFRMLLKGRAGLEQIIKGFRAAEQGWE